MSKGDLVKAMIPVLSALHLVWNARPEIHAYPSRFGRLSGRRHFFPAGDLQ